MANSKVKEIAEQVAQLSPETQLGLLERLVHQLRAAITGIADPKESELTAMAADPEIQRELSRIDNEFRATECDGLGRL